MSKPREWWISIPPEDSTIDQECMVSCSAGYYGDERDIKVIEKSAYDDLKYELAELQEMNGHISATPLAQVVQERDKFQAELKQALAEIERLRTANPDAWNNVWLREKIEILKAEVIKFKIAHAIVLEHGADIDKTRQIENKHWDAACKERDAFKSCMNYWREEYKKAVDKLNACYESNLEAQELERLKADLNEAHSSYLASEHTPIEMGGAWPSSALRNTINRQAIEISELKLSAESYRDMLLKAGHTHMSPDEDSEEYVNGYKQACEDIRVWVRKWLEARS